MTRKIDDQNPANWVKLQDWKKELAQSGTSLTQRPQSPPRDTSGSEID
jgi:hypothetical protein